MYAIQEAQNFLSERVGKLFGVEAGDPTLLGSHKHPTKAIQVRFGASAGAALLVDADSAVVIEGWEWAAVRESMYGRGDPQSVRCLPPPSQGSYSLAKTVAHWLLDARRKFPVLAVIPGKASSVRNLALSHSRASMFLVTPQRRIAFDRNLVAQAYEYIVADPERQKQWMSACRVRQELQSLAALEPAQQRALTARALASRQLFPADVWLPPVISGDFEILKMALIKGIALDLSPAERGDQG